MRSFSFWLGAAALLSGVNCQVTSRYCDQLSRCFISRTTQSGIVVGIALPEVQAAPFDVILQVTAPIEIGWAGFSWGGGMSYTPLAITWANGNSVKISSRMAYTYSLPTAYEGSTYTLLEGSYVNATHFVTTALCKGCTAWDATGAGERRLDPAGSNTLAAAWSYQPVTDPSRIDTTFAIHQGFDMWGQSFAPGRSPNFNRWATGGSGGSATTSATTSPPASSTLLASTTAVSSSTRAAVPLPSSCGLQSRFPLRSAQGWSWLKIAGSLTNPRGVVVDSRGNLLVVQTGRGVTVHTFRQDGCIASSKTLVNKPALNHGITLSPDGRRLIVSSLVSAFRYDYDPVSQTATNEQVVVKGMEPGGHPTRTAVIPPGAPDLLILSVGSNGNLDGPSLNKGVGRALVKVFNLTSVPSGGFDYRTSGWFLGYGLRNEVAIVVDNNNKVWGVENSADDFTRTVNGVVTDIHEDNPAEELNFLGDPSIANEGWYGYPTCFTVWGGAQFPDGRPAVGSQFVPAPNSTWNDARCERESIPPRLSLQAHSAPLDGKFDRNNQNMYVTLHGSWNRRVPTGFKVVEIPFRLGGNGQYEPVAARDSTTGYRDVLWDPQQGCSMMNCFRPSGLTWDRDFTRMYIASDNVQEGEIYLLAKTG